MPYYKLTGYHSHRHPFLGADEQMSVQLADAGNEGNIIDLDNPLAPGIYEALAADEPAQPVSLGKVLRPFTYGVAGGLVVYGIARRYAKPKVAKQIGVVFGGASILIGLATDFLYREVQAVQAASAQRQEEEELLAKTPVPTPGLPIPIPEKKGTV